ncbi:DUF3859 domain-containing protein [Catenovulum sediminis]|uniref:DUF3859 domain-containing protein n=1 Tax=Catenovulum sediminis TaxID=1740262 RepID=A0ABV1RHM7_9ALTE
MAKSKVVVEMLSYGIYSKWDNNDKSLPKIQEFTTQVPAEVDIEFGFIVNIKKARGAKIRYCIYHPDIPDKHGQAMPPFDGEEYVRNNSWDFYLGDTIWLPIEDKIGEWRMEIELDNKIIASKTFDVFQPESAGEIGFWKKRGF